MTNLPPNFLKQAIAMVNKANPPAGYKPKKWTSLKSSNIDGFSYDPKTKELVVGFKGGARYKYSDVPHGVARSLKRSKSPGKALNRRVKKPGFAYQKIAEEFSMTPLAMGFLEEIEKFAMGDMMEYFQKNPKKFDEWKARRQAKDKLKAKKKRERTAGSMLRDRIREGGRPMRKVAGVAKRQTTFDGLKLKLEYDPGDIRTGTSKKTGKVWKKKMKASYGYIPGTRSSLDGEAVDIYLAKSPQPGARIYIVRQVKPDGKPDEDKVMLGFGSADEAQKTYLGHTPRKFFGSMKGVSRRGFEKYLEKEKRV